MERYRVAQEWLASYKAQHEDVIGAYEGAVEDFRESRKALETLALERSTAISKGKYVVHEDDRYTVRHKVGVRRHVDAGKLLKKYPKLRGWDGLLSVTLGKYDAAVEAGQIGPKDAEAFVTEKFTNSVEIIEKTDHGETD